ncbi:Glycosyltransferase involved in cell wall biosynthesis OS=Streptomyces griseomycini OX=66895 GN=FHS37_006305 PE=4 SV=1 [Streptomyces griseomycini]
MPLLTESVRLLRARGRAAHLVVAGSGTEAEAVRRALGPDVTLLGPLPQDRLARVYAGCDVFPLSRPARRPSATSSPRRWRAAWRSSCAEGAHTTRWLTAPGRDGIVVRHDDPRDWADALCALVDRPAGREAVRRRAAATARNTHRSWDHVLEEDLLPVWSPRSPGTAWR